MLIMICGGALFMLELASSHSAGHESTLGHLMSEGSIWLSVAIKKVSYYGLLFLASVVNSALMVALVQVLRTVDRQFSRKVQRRWPSSTSYVPQQARRVVVGTPVARVPAASVVVSKSPLHHSFLLSPIVR
ncbi:hypothetical protein BGE01nite_18120 [Brevifollis gellanilyticus]|uniref:Uncharacterized protein n=2 Tax=Brevifollis gellanilyticus TaxID=748831 RepID=A0A512M845_9BACT|nr:hypothetical protein BGE01nite_18120 [Brevifollis gellanilyticus]